MIITFLAPAVLCYLLVFLYPSVRTTIMSFFKVESVSDPISSWRFNGLGNYRTLFATAIFKQAMRNIMNIWLVGLGVMAVALFCGFLTNGMRFVRFSEASSIFQTSFPQSQWERCGSTMSIIPPMDCSITFLRNSDSRL